MRGEARAVRAGVCVCCGVAVLCRWGMRTKCCVLSEPLPLGGRLLKIVVGAAESAE